MDATHILADRYIGSSRCPSGYTYRSNGYCYRNSWYSWGRWVLVGVLIFFALVFLFLCTCCARRRSRKGAKPMYGTGWMGNKWGGNNNNNNQNTYNQSYPQQTYPQQGAYDYNQPQPGGYQAPPNYGNSQQPQNTGTTFNPNEGYYGNQQYGAPQHPPNTYQPEGGYAPPPGPPPGK
ncbi:Chitin synthesis regulation, Congo red resistance, RCR protein [Akanthomyces lecanii RCEF 1005]|uniref:Chitin synthesis regulation, Congo red resistance, RCR protein n=1 Tax=Akanthomyces lecanii RCEF 1005 TaxID=1081108 RepID=A0A162K7V1_CORDF|nr:Chitin synthesis regulation, Congo red resistance, RCR protein [Akanthomyces lecanii RCEF 1005]